LAIQITIDSLSTKLDFEQGAIGFLLESIKPEFYFFPEGMGSRIRYGTSPRQVTHYVPAERFMVIPIFAQVINLLLSVYRGLVQPGTLELQTPTQFSMKQLLFDYLSDLNGALNTPGTYKVIDMGSIIVGNRQISFQDSIHDAKFPIYSAGSGLAQLSGIIIPLARLNPDFLIVEEPEVNLHPDAQLKVAEYLGEVSTSRRILITTHSHYLIAKLAILYSKGVIRTLSGYYIDLASGVTRKLEMNRENASVELPQSIESAMESLASEAMKLEHNFTTREN
jgi:predicted ATPase